MANSFMLDQLTEVSMCKLKIWNPDPKETNSVFAVAFHGLNTQVGVSIKGNWKEMTKTEIFLGA